MAGQPDQVVEAFRMFDFDCDGYIRADEIATPIRALGHVITNAEMDNLLRRARIDIRSGVDFQTFRRLVDSLQRSDYAKLLTDAFQVIDKDGTGSVSASELRHLLTNLGDKMSDDEFNILLEELDIDKSGKVTSSDVIYLLSR